MTPVLFDLDLNEPDLGKFTIRAAYRRRITKGVVHDRQAIRGADGQVQSLAKCQSDGCADQISSEDRKRERGAFFGSIHATLNHLLWADQIWMHRFAGTERPSGGIKESVAHYPDWQDLKREREALDKVILRWAESLDPSWPEGNLTWYSGAAQMEITRYVDPCGCSQPPYPARFCRRRTLSSRPSRSGGLRAACLGRGGD